jgi:putative DNA primase/helicase
MTSDPFEGLFKVRPHKSVRRPAGAIEVSTGGISGEDINLKCAILPLNDYGNAQRLRLRYGDDLRFVKEAGGWLAWRGLCWTRDGAEDLARHWSHTVAEEIKAEAKAFLSSDLSDLPTREERSRHLYAWAQASGNESRSEAMLSVAATYLSAKIEELDCDPYLLGAPNGTIRLGLHCELVPPRREDLITKSVGAAYNPKALCPRWDEFLERVLPDADLREFVRRICGYCLTGSIKEHKLFLLFGSGRNGKSTFVNVFRNVARDYSVGMPVGALLAKRDGRSGAEPSPDLARLPGARLVTAAEPPEGARLDESRVKEITGGDILTVRHLNQGFFEFRPSFKVMLSTNHLPTIRGSDHGIWARVFVVPFPVQIPDSEIDRDLEEKLLAEKEGILQWMLTGIEEWFANGLSPPPGVVAEVEEYRADQDPVGEFLKAKCELCPGSINPSTGRQFEVNTKRLYEAYCNWCKGENLDPFTPQTFGRKVRARGLTRRKSGDDRFWVGLHLNMDPV